MRKKNLFANEIKIFVALLRWYDLLTRRAIQKMCDGRGEGTNVPQQSVYGMAHRDEERADIDKNGEKMLSEQP